MKANEIKTMDEATKFYNDEFNKIKEMDATNETKAMLLVQLNKTMTVIYNSMK
ncbi:MAG: hypothetical protein PHC95_15780 [Parabacteroides sp.]|nr:hypothetical protein [Parabacteroides sp.]